MAHRLFRVAFRVLLIALAAMVVLAIAGVLYERWSVRVTIGKLADDLKVLLERNEIPPPYILVLRRSAA